MTTETKNPLPFDPEEYWYWVERFAAGYGKTPEELARIPEAIKRTYIFKKLIEDNNAQQC